MLGETLDPWSASACKCPDRLAELPEHRGEGFLSRWHRYLRDFSLLLWWTVQDVLAILLTPDALVYKLCGRER
jgi:hypothetical protein